MITLTSDFGTPYPAAMKGVILKRCDARLVDVAHDLPRQDVRSAAFWLTQVLPEFPPAVHLAVVDPGVGTDRNALVIRAGDHLLVGPDNGVLLPPARELASGGNGDDYETDIDAYELEIEDPRSSTFHGRDVFAPAAAAVHEAGIDRLPEVDGVTPAEDVVDLRLPDPELGDDGATGDVLAIDDFGNTITNVPGDVLDGHDTVHIDGEEVPVVASYAHAEVGQRVATVGSHEKVEFAVNQGRGDDAFGLSVGDSVRVDWA
ncbi:SAM hydrolase/SAM-dependent halogenase family protein [Natronomonas amylolytica]|uniref:SAM hydrolase/SAM-dependent halogenase family protein n=1 Tax=Natronomonas amylolytica TaxID=3108498 RepID=UPI00300BF852